MERKNKLYIWVWDDFCSDYTSGLAVAIAPDYESARKEVIRAMGDEPYSWGDYKKYPMKKQAFGCYGGS